MVYISINEHIYFTDYISNKKGLRGLVGISHDIKAGFNSDLLTFPDSHYEQEMDIINLLS